ncbi:MAG TPA: nucleotidyltransferase family protein [Salinimicrobium sp.]|nr:nucleotidyltransferase family protein [Salinimicrobium sp.]
MALVNITIHKDETVLVALQKLNDLLLVRKVSQLIIFVIDDQQAVIGSLTDGDIRRSLVKHADLDKRVEEICNKDFVYEHERDGYFDLNNYRAENIKILPILDKQGKLLRIIDLEKTRSELPLDCMIMAGGRGKRLSPLTDTVPKPMLPLGGRPIIEHNIDRLVSFGIKNIYISVKYLGEQIQEYFGDGSKKGINIQYIWEDEPLGTAGALALVEKYNTENVLLMNSDLFTNVNFEDLYLGITEENADMAVASTEYKVDIPFAVFDTQEEQVMNFKEKPSYVYHSNAGIYILKKELIDEIPKNEFYDITDLMDKVVKRGGKLIHRPIRGFWIDIGSPTDYKQAQEFVKHLE